MTTRLTDERLVEMEEFLRTNEGHVTFDQIWYFHTSCELLAEVRRLRPLEEAVREIHNQFERNGDLDDCDICKRKFSGLMRLLDGPPEPLASVAEQKIDQIREVLAR